MLLKSIIHFKCSLNIFQTYYAIAHDIQVQLKTFFLVWVCIYVILKELSAKW